MIRLFTFFTTIIFILSSCSSGKKAMQQGNYDEAIYKAAKRLRSNASHKKSLETLRTTYPLAQTWHLNRIKNIEASYDPFKWEPIVSEYESLIRLNEEILTCPGCLKAVPTPANYSMEFERAKLKAASERYEAGLVALEKGKKGDRNEAKLAYNHFATANSFIINYKESEEKLKEAEMYATINVIVEPIPMHSQALKISNEFFDNKINEFLLNSQISRFVKFYTAKEAKKLGISRPDQILQLVFDDFVVGQTYMHEKELNLIRDSIVLATYEVELANNNSDNNSNTGSNNGQGNNNSNESNNDTKGKITICHTAPGSGKPQTITVSESALKAHLDHGDQVGPCNGSAIKTSTTSETPGTTTSNNNPGTRKEVRKVYGQAKATMHIFTRTVESKGLLDLRILDGYTRRVISQEKLPGAFVWQSQWGYFNGDERALDKQQLQIVKNKEVPPPPPQDLFIQFTQPIYQQVIAKISNFYRNY